MLTLVQISTKLVKLYLGLYIEKPGHTGIGQVSFQATSNPDDALWGYP
jgi:hypothetical protein